MSEIINIVFENRDFVVCDKPGNVLSVPDRFFSDRLCLGLELQHELQLQIFPVHRLDFEVSGLIIYAKNARAHKASQNWFENKTITKKYCALTTLQNFSQWPSHVPHPEESIEFKEKKSFLWEMKLQRGKKRSFESPHGDYAKTKAVMNKLIQDQFIVWEMYPITGRAHQLRLELARHGFAILDDKLYGGIEMKSVLKAISLDRDGSWPYTGIGLRAEAIYFSEIAQSDFDLPKSLVVESFKTTSAN